MSIEIVQKLITEMVEFAELIIEKEMNFMSFFSRRNVRVHSCLMNGRSAVFFINSSKLFTRRWLRPKYWRVQQFLRNITVITQIGPNAARWSGKSNMLKRYPRIKEILAMTRDDDNACIPMGHFSLFVEGITKSHNMIDELNYVTKSLQFRRRTLAACQGDINILQRVIRKPDRKPTWKLYNYKLGGAWLGMV